MTFVKRVHTEEAERALTDLRRVAEDIEQVRAEEDRLVTMRDELIREASHEGATRRAVAEAGRVTAAWVQRLVKRDA